MAQPPDEPSKQAIITALRLLAASPKSGHELKDKLVSKGYPPEAVRFALNELGERGLIDDKVYANNLTRQLIHGKSSGKHKIAFELKRHGIPESIRKEILNSLTESDEKERALEQARLKWAGFQSFDSKKRRKKIFDHLIRKGYDFQVVHEVMDEISKDPETDGLR